MFSTHEGSIDTENHCGYLLNRSLSLAKSPFVKSTAVPETKASDLIPSLSLSE